MDQLNQYVLMEIFDYLDAASLKCCAQTCTSWAKIISMSTRAMKRLPLMIDSDRIGDQKERVKDIKYLRRNYHTLMMDDIKLTCKISNPLQRIAANIKVLELVRVDLTEAAWKKLLERMTAIENIIIVDSKISAVKKQHIEAFALPTLKSLTLFECEWNFLLYLQNTQIEEFKIHNRSSYAGSIEDMKVFIQKQENLKSLIARVQQIYFYVTLFNSKDNPLKFKLRKLSISNRHLADEESAKRVIDFMDQHKDTLEYLEVDSKMNEKIFEFIFKNLKLETLVLNATFLPRESITFYSAIRPNPHLKKLVLMGDLTSSIAAQGLFGIYREIENLSISNMAPSVANDALIIIINQLTKATHLRIPYLGENVTEIPMPSLKDLTIECCRSKIEFQSFIVNQSNLEKLTVKWIYEDMNEVMEEVLPRLPNLKSAIFGPGFKPSLKTLKSFKSNCPKMHNLEIFHDIGSSISNEILNEVNGNGFKTVQYKNEAASKLFLTEKSMWHHEDKFYMVTSSLASDSETEMDFNDSDEDFDSDDPFDSDDDYYMNNYYGNSDDDSDDMNFHHRVMQEVINFFIN